MAAEVGGADGSGALGALAARASAAALAAVGLGAVPVMWVFVALNVATQYVRICGVYMLLEARDPLTVNVLLTVRKAASVVFSVVIFGNTFTPFHVAGAALVFGASLAFMAEPPSPAPAAAAAAAAKVALAAAAAEEATASDEDAGSSPLSGGGDEAARLRSRGRGRKISVAQ